MTETQTAEAEDFEFWWHLSDEELVATRGKIDKLNARAARRGLAGHLEVEAERVTETETLPSGFEVTKVYWAVRVTGEAPHYNGWRFIATLDFDPAAGLITKTVPGYEGTIDRSALRENHCDHCNTDRQRNETYLVRHATTGETRQVGSACIKDFLGGHSARPVIYDREFIREELGGGGFGASDYDVTPETALGIAWAAIQEYGFERSSASEYYGGGVPTKFRLEQVLYPRSKPQEAALTDRAVGDKLRPLAEQAKSQAKLIKDYILSDAFEGDGEYVTNLKNVLRGERVSRKFFGLLASAPQAWARSVERDLRRQAEKAQLVNETFGAAGDKVELTVTVKSIRYLDSHYGTTTLYTLVTSDGHLVKWFSSSAALGDEVTTAVFTIKATIKKFDEYQGTHFTVITRARVLTKEAQAA